MRKQTFTEKVEVDEKSGTIKITVSCEKRKLAIEEKIVYTTKVETLIPEDLRNNFRLVSKPDKTVSNLTLKDHTNVGHWIFKSIEIKKPQKTTRKKKPSTTRTRSLRTRKTK